MYPGARALGISQDRLTEKTFLNEQGCKTAPFAAVDSLEDLKAAIGLAVFFSDEERLRALLQRLKQQVKIQKDVEQI